MFGKKNQDPKTALDLAIENKLEEVYEANSRLRGRVNKVIIKQNVIDLYPEGPDKEKAITDCNEAKYSMLCAIGAYDDLLNQYKNLCKKEGERNITINWTSDTLSTSHEIVENTFRNFWRKA